MKGAIGLLQMNPSLTLSPFILASATLGDIFLSNLPWNCAPCNNVGYCLGKGVCGGDCISMLGEGSLYEQLPHPTPGEAAMREDPCMYKQLQHRTWSCVSGTGEAIPLGTTCEVQRGTLGWGFYRNERDYYCTCIGDCLKLRSIANYIFTFAHFASSETVSKFYLHNILDIFYLTFCIQSAFQCRIQKYFGSISHSNRYS